MRGTDRRGNEIRHALKRPIRSFGGARAARIVNGAGVDIAEHRHDWPILSLYVLGEYEKVSESGTTLIDGPSAVWHRAGEAHANRIHGGLEQIDLEIDPRWLGPDGILPAEPVKIWRGGRIALEGAMLGRMWCDPLYTEQELARATRRFLALGAATTDVRRPAWLTAVQVMLADGRAPTAREMGIRLGLQPVWLAAAYRAAAGEGLRQTSARLRVQNATRMLRHTQTPAAIVAVECGFCDQSHMIRTFKAVLSRTPSEIRAERDFLAGSARGTLQMSNPAAVSPR